VDDVTLLQGDCLDILPTLGAGSVDCVITDPPYGKGYHDGGLSEIPRHWENPPAARFAGVKIAGDERPNTLSIPEMARVLREGGAIYVFSQWMVEAEWIAAIRDAGLSVRNRLIWAKPYHGAGDLKTTYGPQHESILYATKGRHELIGSRDGDVWNQSAGSDGFFANRKGKAHPNQKPLELIRWLIQKSSRPGNLILDPFAGSGTTAVACMKTGRRCIAIEIDPRYIAIIERRVKAAETPLFQGFGVDILGE
jgi:DNA modification methylase